MSVAVGTTIPLQSVGYTFTDDDIGRIVRAWGGKLQITSLQTGGGAYPTGGAWAKVTETLTEVIPNDPNNTLPNLVYGEWSLASLVTSVSRLNSLEGMTVTALADGSVVPNQVVTNGSITLPNPASYIVVGLPYTCQVQTLYLDHPEGPEGTFQTKRKNISSIGIRLESSRGVQVGANQVDASSQPNQAPQPWINMQEIKDRNNQVFAGSAVPLYTGDYYKAITSGWNEKGQIAVQQVYPLPISVLAVMPYWVDGDSQ